MIQGIPLSYFLILGAVLFFVGVFGFLTRRTTITMLMSIELMLNAVNINFIAFNKYLYPNNLQGNFYSLFVIAIAAAECSVAIAIILNVYRNFQSISVDKVEEMKN